MGHSIETWIREKPWHVLGVLALAAFLPHMGYLWGFFLLDDFWHLSYLQDPGYIFSIWRVARADLNQVWYLTPVVDPEARVMKEMVYYFRPFTVFSMWLDNRIWGFHAVGFHLQNLLWHIANALLLFRVAQKSKLPDLTAFIAALIFAIHPAVAEPQTWICARGDMMVVTFGLIASLFYLSWRDNPKPRFILGMLIALTLGVFSKESEVVWALVWLCYEGVRLLTPDHEDTHDRRPPWLLLALLALLLIPVFGQSIFTSGQGMWSVARANRMSFLETGPLGIIGFNSLSYFMQLIDGRTPISSYFLDGPAPLPLTVVGLFMIVLSLYVLKRLRRRRLLWAYFWAGGFTAAMIWTPTSARYLYGVMPGLAVLLAHVGVSAWQTPTVWRKRLYRAACVGALLLWITCSAVISLQAALLYSESRRQAWELVEAIQAHPEATDIYLVNQWPYLHSIFRTLALMADRPDLKVHLIIPAPSYSNPHLSPLALSITRWMYRLPDTFFDPQHQSVRMPFRNVLDVHSEPQGFGVGPLSLKPQEHHEFVKPNQRLRVNGMWVKIGKASPKGGYESLRFTFERDLADKRNLWAVWINGDLRIWQPHANKNLAWEEFPPEN